MIYSKMACALAVLALTCRASIAADAPRNDAASTGTKALTPIRRTLPGVRPDGTVQLPNQWSLKPAGRQIALGDFPVNLALHPGGRWAAALHGGYGEHEIAIVDLKSNVVVSRATLKQTYLGLCFSPDGEQLFASGGELEVIHRFSFADGFLSQHEEWPLGKVEQTLVPSGLAVSGDGQTLYAACCFSSQVAALPMASPHAPRFASLPADSFPYAVTQSSDGRRLFVSLWGRASIAVLDAQSLDQIAIWETPDHPCEMLLSPANHLLYVACANSNLVSAIDVESGKSLELISSSLYPSAPVGSTPNSIALSLDGRALLIANADNNNVAAIDVTQRGKARSLGFIPVGWYPTSVRVAADGDILVLNGKGLASKSNRQGPNSDREPPKSVKEYIGGLFHGTLSVIKPPSPQSMVEFTKSAFACSPLRQGEATRDDARSADNPIPREVGQPCPIQHCIYIIKENRTYDQVFGDLPQGNGDPALCLFPERVTPNLHALATEFVLLDNCYVESEVSADGHEWTVAAYATDFVEKSWPLAYRDGNLDKVKYPAEGAFAHAASAGGYLWDRCREAGLDYLSFGEFVANPVKPDEPLRAKTPALEGHIDPHYWAYDLDYPDAKRADRFIARLSEFEASGKMPSLLVLHLPNDHTHGTARGKPTPAAMVAENDLALGRIVEAISRSRFWPTTAIFVIEDDAQNGSDHVDAHRTEALVVSPYTKRRHVDSNLYSTSSMLRTMELILGLKPMSQFDAAALPMYDSFQATPNLAPYDCRPAQIDLHALNGSDAWGAEISATLDFSREDAADDLVLNEIIWRSVRGADSPAPPPVRASFVFAHPVDDDDADDDEIDNDDA